MRGGDRVSTGAAIQNLINMNNTSNPEISSPTSREGPEVKLNNLKSKTPTFLNLLNQKQGGSGKTKPINFKKLLNLLNLSNKELKMNNNQLKTKLKNMDQKGLKELKDITEFVYLNLLKQLQLIKDNSDVKFNSLSRKKLDNLKAGLENLQQVINNLSENTNRGNSLFSQGKNSLNSSDFNNEMGIKSNNQSITKNNVDLTEKNAVVSGKQKQEQNINIKPRDSLSGNKATLISEKNGVKQNNTILQTKVEPKVQQRAFNPVDISRGKQTPDKSGKANIPQIIADSLKKTNFRLSDLKKGSELTEAKSKIKGFNLSGEFSDRIKSLGGQTDSFNNNSQFNHNFSQQNQGQFSQLTNETISNSTGNSGGVLTAEDLAGLKENNTINQVSEQIKMMHKQGQNEVKIQLEPEFLGKVKLNLKVKAGEVTAKFVVDNLLVKNHLDQNIAALRNNLLNQGFDVDQMEVESENNHFDMNQEGQSEDQYSSQEKNQGQNGQGYGYDSNYLDMSPEELEELVQSDPEHLQQIGMLDQGWMTLNRQYQRMNIFA